jgi:hypothetical protein
MNQTESVPGEQDGSESSAHSLKIGIEVHLVGNRRVALMHSRLQFAEQIAARLVIIEVGQRGNHQLGRDLPRGVSTHTVG